MWTELMLEEQLQATKRQLNEALRTNQDLVNELRSLRVRFKNFGITFNTEIETLIVLNQKKVNHG